MLDLLGRRNHHRVARRVVVSFAHHLLTFRDQAFHSLALLTSRGNVQLLERLLEALDMLLGLTQVLFERLFELFARCLLRHLRKRFGQLLLGVVHVSQLVLQEIVERFETSHTLCLLKKTPPSLNATAKARVVRTPLCGRSSYGCAGSVQSVHRNRMTDAPHGSPCRRITTAHFIACESRFNTPIDI